MKVKLLLVTLLLVTGQFALYGQIDSLQIKSGHLRSNPTMAYPKGDGLTYDQYVGETSAGFRIAQGWRLDSVNGGFNKALHGNPYVSSQGDYVGFDKNKFPGSLKFYRYASGRKFTGQIRDTLAATYSHPRGAGVYYFIETGYESKSLKVLFKADCIDGVLRGKGTLSDLDSKQVLSYCNFKDGEIVGAATQIGVSSKYISTVKYKKGSTVALSRTETTKDGDKPEPERQLSFSETLHALLYPYEILKRNKKANQTYVDNLNTPWRLNNPLFIEPLHILSTYISSIREQRPKKAYKTDFFEVSDFQYEDITMTLIGFNRQIGNTGTQIIECKDKSGKLILVWYQNVPYELIHELNSNEYTRFAEKTGYGYNLIAYEYDRKGKIKKASKYTGVDGNDVDSRCMYEDVTTDLLSASDFKPISIVNR